MSYKSRLFNASLSKLDDRKQCTSPDSRLERSDTGKTLKPANAVRSWRSIALQGSMAGIPSAVSLIEHVYQSRFVLGLFQIVIWPQTYDQRHIATGSHSRPSTGMSSSGELPQLSMGSDNCPMLTSVKPNVGRMPIVCGAVKEGQITV